MIQIEKSKTADTRSCGFAAVTRQQLYDSSVQHIGDVRKGLLFFASQLVDAGARHDFDKLSDIEGFHADFVTGFAQTGWWDKHRRVNRHHLLQADGVPHDVNLVDVLDMIADCVMAGMGRTGEVYPLNISPDVLMSAFENTVKLLKSQVVVAEPLPDKSSQAPFAEQCDYKLALSFGDLVVRYADADYIRARFEMMPPAEFYAAYVEPAFRQFFTAKDQASTPAVLKD